MGGMSKGGSSQSAAAGCTGTTAPLLQRVRGPCPSTRRGCGLGLEVDLEVGLALAWCVVLAICYQAEVRVGYVVVGTTVATRNHDAIQKIEELDAQLRRYSFAEEKPF